MRPEAPPSELAVAVARHFEGMEVDEEECIGGFLERLEKGTGPTEYTRKTCYFDGRAPQPAVRKRKRTKLAARPLEQVCCCVCALLLLSCPDSCFLTAKLVDLFFN